MGEKIGTEFPVDNMLCPASELWSEQSVSPSCYAGGFGRSCVDTSRAERRTRYWPVLTDDELDLSTVNEPLPGKCRPEVRG